MSDIYLHGPWTYGCEHELADWDRRKGLPEGCDLDLRDVTMVNSNGIAVDPRGELYPYGGELRTRPTPTPRGQVDVLKEFLAIHPDAAVNYRSNLHVHVRVPGLRDDLDTLKALALYNDLYLRKLFPLIEPIPAPTASEYPERAAFAEARRRYRRRRRSHQTTLARHVVENQQRARTTKEFHDFGVPWTAKGKPQPYLQARCAVNLRQLMETDTIEFRHFPGTLDEEELLTAVEWCRDYLNSFFGGTDPTLVFQHRYADRRWPKFKPFVPWMEEKFQRTVRGSAHLSIVKEEIANE